MAAWRAGVDYRSGGQAAPVYLSSEVVHGPQPPADYNGLPLTGSYAGALLIESNFIPAGYVAVVSSGGPNSHDNLVGFREHTNPAYQGLRIIPGRDQRYPHIESYLVRSFGVGVRHRGAVDVCQITN